MALGPLAGKVPQGTAGQTLLNSRNDGHRQSLANADEHYVFTLLRGSQRDSPALNECIRQYGNFIWALANKFTDSDEEAEAATQEIFIDIWSYAKQVETPEFDENAVITQIARRRLIKYLQQVN